jgi:uncharacterized protein YjbI with pentapeptide repeats
MRGAEIPTANVASTRTDIRGTDFTGANISGAGSGMRGAEIPGAAKSGARSGMSSAGVRDACVCRAGSHGGRNEGFGMDRRNAFETAVHDGEDLWLQEFDQID